MDVEPQTEVLQTVASATGGGSLVRCRPGIAKKEASTKVAVRVLSLPRVKVLLDADVARQHGLAPGEAAEIPHVTAAMETQWRKDLKTTT